MPVFYSDFRSPWWMPGGNLQTQLPVWLRWKFPIDDWVSINTRDNDELSASWHKSDSINLSDQLIIITHGLEGSNRQHYISGAINYFQSTLVNPETGNKKPDVLAWNLRGCGRRENKTHKLYFSGCVSDLDDVIGWAEKQGYQSILLVGYSLGANITLRWLGNQSDAAKNRGIKAVCTASATVDLQSSVTKLDKWKNIIYRLIFVTSMKWRLISKARKYPAHIDLTHLHRVKSFATYDEYYSAPLNGFADTNELYQASSAIHVLDKIQVPCLIVQAQNDPFLATESIPISLLENHSSVTLEVCESGGHVGFLSNRYEWYLDKRFVDFFQQAISPS